MEDEVGTKSPVGAVVKGKRTKRHRPHSPIPGFRVSVASASATDTNDSPPLADHQEAAASSESNYSLSNGAAAMASAAPVTSSDRLNTEEEEDMANCLIMLAQDRRFGDPRRDQEKFTSRRFLEASPNSASGGYYVYECKTCSKTFLSFQALGGHRASHKKPKLLPATATKDEESRSRRSNNLVLSDDDQITTTTTPENRPPPAIKVNHSISNNSLSLQLTNRALYNSANTTSTTTGNKQRVHECSICGAEFASGQALGGHMRRHRGLAVGGNQTAPIAAADSMSLTLHVEEDEEKRSSSSSAVHPITNALSNKKPSLDLDLNLPAMLDAEEVNRSEPKLVFPGKKPPPLVLEGEPQPPPPPPPATQAQKQQLVFSPAALVDCHY